MYYLNNNGYKPALLACLIFLVTIPAYTVAADDDYLSALSEEADSLETLGNARRELNKVKANVHKQNESVVASKVAVVSVNGMKQLENELMKYFPASYKLYQQLNNTDRELVYSEYSNAANKSHDARIFSAINKIIILQAST